MTPAEKVHRWWLVGLTIAFVAMFVGPSISQFDGKIRIGWPSLVAPVVRDALVVIVHDESIGLPDYAEHAINQLRAAGRQVRLTGLNPQTGLGTVPKEIAPALAPGKAAGVPALVLLQGDKVLKVIKLPATTEAILEACK